MVSGTRPGGSRIRGLVLALAAALVLVACAAPPFCEEAGCDDLSELRHGVALGGAYHILDREDEPLASVGGERRRWVFLDALPERIPAAWIAVEDRRFRDHDGVDFRAFARATRANLRARTVVEGASTIPMQLVRALWPEAVAGFGPWERKVLEARVAPRLVSELGRDRVLELYLNAIYLGDGQYGIGAAAHHYFDVAPEDLTLAQTAMLVALTKTPEAFHPREHPERARERRDLVLEILAREGVAGADEVRRARASEVALADEDPVSRERSYVTTAVLRELRRVAPELVGRGGITLHTTIDPRVQEEAVTLMTDHLEGIQEGALGRYLGDGQAVQGAAIVMESSTGGILGVVGGRDFASTQLNRALQSRRPVGSLVKPLVFAAALERGVRATRPLATAHLAVETDEGPWSPRDHVTEPYLLPHDMVVLSSNRAAVRLGQEVGVRAFASFAEEMGIDGDIPPFPSTFLGVFDASLVQMTAAFAVFDNGGHAVDPHLITRIVSGEGVTVWSRDGAAPTRRLLNAGTADLVLDAMRGVVNQGTGFAVRRHLQGEAAGKTGTTTGGADAWFVGVRPGIAAGVWIGLDRPAPITEGGSGATLAAPLWGRWMSAIAPLGYGEGEWILSDRLTRVSLGEQPEGDSIRYCRGGDGPLRLVHEWDVRELSICEPTPLEQLRPRPGWTDLQPGERVPIRLSPDTASGGGGASPS